MSYPRIRSRPRASVSPTRFVPRPAVRPASRTGKRGTDGEKGTEENMGGVEILLPPSPGPRIGR